MFKTKENFAPDANRISAICLEKFESLPKTGKPILGKEWTVLSAIVKFDHSSKEFEVVAMGTGTKCIGKSTANNQGAILNDSHAEVMCRRGFLRYLLEQIDLAKENKDSIFFFDEIELKFDIFDYFSFHIVTTHAPCGDASIYSVGKTNEENVIGKRRKIEKNQNAIVECDLQQREYSTGAKIVYNGIDVQYDLMDQTIGIIRTKPGRGEPTLSVSCSDKLAKWNVLGLQGALIFSILSNPIYFNSVTLCDKEYCNVDAVKRAIWLRFCTSFTPSYSFKVNRPIIQMSSIEFKYKKAPNLVPAAGSIVWFGKNSHQVAVNGKRLGVTKKNQKKHRLNISKIEIFRKYLQLLQKITNIKDITTLRYCDAKKAVVEYQQVWNDLKRDYFKQWTSKPRESNNFSIY